MPRGCWVGRVAPCTSTLVAAGSIEGLVAGRTAVALVVGCRDIVRAVGRMAVVPVVGRRLAAVALLVHCSEDIQTEAPPEGMSPVVGCSCYQDRLVRCKKPRLLSFQVSLEA